MGASTTPRETLPSINHWNRTPSTWIEMVSLLRKLDVHRARTRENPNASSFRQKGFVTNPIESLGNVDQDQAFFRCFRVKSTSRVRRELVGHWLSDRIGVHISGRLVVNSQLVRDNTF